MKENRLGKFFDGISDGIVNGIDALAAEGKAATKKKTSLMKEVEVMKRKIAKLEVRMDKAMALIGHLQQQVLGGDFGDDEEEDGDADETNEDED